MSTISQVVAGGRILADHINQLVRAFSALGITDDAPTPPWPRSVNVRVYTANDTWSKPAGLLWIRERVVGGGGGGGGADNDAAAGGGGGGGGYSEKLIDAADLNATEIVTIGAGGSAGGATGTNGGAGGTTSFGAHGQATGGDGGVGGSSNGIVSDGGEGGIG